MALSSKVITNLFEHDSGDYMYEYAKVNYFVSFPGNEDLYYGFKQICSQEKAALDEEATKEARKLAGDERLVFKRHIPKNRLLFVLYVMGLWTPDEKTSNGSIGS